MTHRFVLAAAFAGLTLPPVAAAQSTINQRAFVTVYGGAQVGGHDSADRFTFPAYEELATVETTQTYGGGPVFALGGGVKVTNSVFVGAQFSRSSDDATSTASASIPNPLIFNRPRSASFSSENFEHRERALHLMAGYWLPLSDVFDVTVSVGPTFFRVTHEVMSSVQVAESSFPFSTVAITSASATERSETTVGFNIGAEGAYRLTPHLGLGGFMRLAKANVDVPGASQGGTVEVGIGGVQIGFGLNVRF